jgi:tetratricopeptide (TPR) repeat protein
MNEFNYEIINDYLSGELTGEALQAFEREMQANKNLANEVALYKIIQDELSFDQQNKVQKNELANTLSTLNKTHFVQPTAKVVSFKKWIYAATALAAAAVLFFIFRPIPTEVFNNETVFASYTKNIEELSVGQRGNVVDTLLINAATLYNKKEYAAALPILQKIIIAKPQETSFTLATGVCYLQTLQYGDALKLFTEIENGNSVFKQQATWYKALTYLKQNKLSDCYNVLKTIPTDADKYKEATELMKKIEDRK